MAAKRFSNVRPAIITVSGNGRIISGGDIIFVADDHLSTLMDFRYKRKYVAPEGGKGGASLCHGKNAENLVIKVPLGTVIKDAESGLVIADLDIPSLRGKHTRCGCCPA